jgi:hypothetical protein
MERMKKNVDCVVCTCALLRERWKDFDLLEGSMYSTKKEAFTLAWLELGRHAARLPTTAVGPTWSSSIQKWAWRHDDVLMTSVLGIFHRLPTHLSRSASYYGYLGEGSSFCSPSYSGCRNKIKQLNLHVYTELRNMHFQCLSSLVGITVVDISQWDSFTWCLCISVQIRRTSENEINEWAKKKKKKRILSLIPQHSNCIGSKTIL